MDWIYFIQAQESGRIKIGISENPFLRLFQLRTGCCEELALLGCLRGTPKDEAALHLHFKNLRLAGEWFKGEPALLYWIKRSVLSPEVFAAVATRAAEVDRLRKEATAKTAHADALEAETDQLIRSGALVKTPAQVEEFATKGDRSG